MASGTIDNGKFSGAATNQARPLIVWSSTTNVANNTSSVTASLVYRKISAWNSYNLNGHNVTITINGNSASANKTFDIRPGGDFTIWSRTVTVTHNSDGAKSISIGASGNTGVSLGSYNFSQTVTLDTIPRASSLSAFSFNANLKSGTENKINYTVNRRSTSFRHQIQLRDGSTTVFQWDNISSNGTSNIDLTASNVNTLLNRMKTSTTKSFTLRVATRSGVNGSWVGSAVTRSATATVHADEKPKLSALSVSQVGNSISTDYLQNISKVKASFTRSAGYGASITSSRIIVRRVDDKGNSQTIASNDGTTSNVISLVGTYEVIAQATDSRGRSGTQLKATFTSVAYSPPVITNFTATRQSNEGEGSKNIDWHREGKHSGLSGKNTATGLLQYRTGSGTWTQIESIKDSAGSWNKSGTVKGLSETNSYEFRFTLTDSLGYSDSQTITVSTARVVLDIHKNEGVGIGKIHEKGILDVDGQVHFLGRATAEVEGIDGDAFRIQSNIKDGHGYLSWNGSDNERKGRIGFLGLNANTKLFTIENLNEEGIRFVPGNGRIMVGWDDVVGQGTNNNGEWVRFYDGTQLAWKNLVITRSGGWPAGTIQNWSAGDPPASFINFTLQPTIGHFYNGRSSFSSFRAQIYPISNVSGTIEIVKGSSEVTSLTLNLMAMGRWK